MRETVPAALAGERVDRLVSLLTGLTRSEVAEMVTAGAVRVGGRTVVTRSRRVAEGDVVEAVLPDPVAVAGAKPDPSVEVAVVYADADIVVVDKPPGLVVHPGAGNETGTLVQGLLARFPDLAGPGVGEVGRPGIVHRLDAGTSGLLVVARTARAYDSLVGQLADRSVERRYLALALGDVEATSGLVDAPIGRSGSDPTRMSVSRRGREARTRYEVLARFTEPLPTSELECRLETGRTHQIRVHLAAIGHPIAGDARYGGSRPSMAIDRPYLHAHHLSFLHPASGERVGFDSPLPADLRRLRSTLS